MTGHTRRASTSSIESVDVGSVKWRQEASILRSVPKSVPSDNWPIFQLRDAIVLNRDGSTVENALHIVPNGPFIVRGYLHYTREEKHLGSSALQYNPSSCPFPANPRRSPVLVRDRSPIPIEIRHCLLYSVGETQDGSPQIWVSGRAGWFELSPCPAYQATYDTMCQATTLYYSIMDIIEAMRDVSTKRGKKSKSKVQSDVLASIFHQYAASVGDGSAYEDVVDRCNRHAIFLISQFMQDDDSMDWQTTAFYKWMKSENGPLFEKVDKAKHNPRQRTRSPSYIEPSPRASTSLSRHSASVEEIDESEFIGRSTRRSNSAAAQHTTIAMHPRQTGQPPAQSPAQSPAQTAQPFPQPSVQPAPTHVATDADSPFQTVLAALESSFDSLASSKNGVKGVKVSAILNKLYFTYRFPTYKDSSVGSHKRPVEEVLHYNAAALLDVIDHEKYKDGEVYDWLVDLSKKEFVPIALKSEIMPLRLAPREQRPFHGRKPETKLTPTQDFVRPPSPATPIIGKRPGRPVGSKSSLRPIKSNKKRSRIFIDDDETDNETVAKKLNFSSDQEGDETMADASILSSQEEELDSALQAKDSSDSSSEREMTDDQDKPAQLTILAEKLPDPMPTGFQGAWACDQQDCDFIARGGGDDELDNRIAAHLQEHEQLVDRMQLAVSESRGLLPINHLLEKLKQLGEGVQGLTDSQGNVAPRPIERHLYV
ncbi:hypothetical protein BBO_07433 [Beauveria brongniartii RCEF 3172]|uniref:DNA (cytosine-5)-methyltransferase 1 replication foci domain-containing protein n=1 Tax=Beauveria brongniartii RCEF 3172 TaxID=1081107 RepID=A0A166ZAR0_9HYPO|nr:hypothetical protein BBO_07433 [Beauveria brongniartii RCEF 3172]